MEVHSTERKPYFRFCEVPESGSRVLVAYVEPLRKPTQEKFKCLSNSASLSSQVSLSLV